MAEDMTGTMNEAENVPQIISSWSMNVQSWTTEANPAFLVLRYEDMLDKPLKAFRKVVRLLGQGKDDKRLRKAIQFSSFRQMQKQELATGFNERHEDARSFFRSGSHDQWRSKLTEAQVGRIVEAHREQMARFRYLPPAYR